MKLKYTAIALLMIFAFSIAAQDTQWYTNKPIQSVVFEGLETVSESDLQGFVNQYVGRDFNNTVFIEFQTQLYALDYFDQFSTRVIPYDDQYSAVVIEITVIEKPLINQIIFQGNQGLRRGELLDTILLKVNDPLDESRRLADENALQQLYVRSGYPDAYVSSRIEVEESLVRLIYEIDEGPLSRIASIDFSGNSFTSGGTLRRVISSKQKSILNKGIFQAVTLEEDKSAILKYYWDRGFVDASILDVDIEDVVDNGERNLNITFFIEEGERYRFDGVTFLGNTLYSDEDLASLVRHPQGNYLNLTRFEQDFLRITDIYYDDGYIFNQISRREVRDTEQNLISFEVSIVEQSRAYIENIILKGNEKTRDSVILRELPLEVGDVFSKGKIMTGLRNLYNLQYFSAVYPETPPGSAEGLMDLVINVEEQRTLDLTVGAAFDPNQEFPLVFTMQLKDINFQGRGQELSVGTEISATKQSLNFGFKENWLMDRRWYAGVDFSFSHMLEKENQDFLSPLFYDTGQSFPDPFEGIYVDEKTGLIAKFDSLEALEAAIEAETVITDYQYYLQNNTHIPDHYRMQYSSFNMSLGLSSGYAWHTFLGRFSVAGGINTLWKYLTYDTSQYRPASASVRNNYKKFQPVTSLNTSLTWDTRDIVYYPTSGFVLRQTMNYTGGILPSNKDFIKSISRGELYFTLWERPFLENLSFTSILAMHSSFSAMFEQRYYTDGKWETGYRASSNDLFATDGMSIAKGWPSHRGKALWDNWIEFRIPFVPGILSLDSFFSATAVYNELTDIQFGLDQFMFSIGAGMRLTIPGFPIGLHLVKPFQFDGDNNIEFIGGDVFGNPDNPESGLVFVISITMPF